MSATQKDMCQEMLVIGGYDRKVVGTVFFPQNNEDKFTKDWVLQNRKELVLKIVIVLQFETSLILRRALKLMNTLSMIAFFVLFFKKPDSNSMTYFKMIVV